MPGRVKSDAVRDLDQSVEAETTVVNATSKSQTELKEICPPSGLAQFV